MIANELLLEYKGKTFNEKTKFDIEKYLKENRIKELKYENKFLPMALVCVQEKKEIMGLGASIPSDLFMNNYGEFFKTIFRAVSTGQTTFSINDLGNVARTLIMYAGTSSFLYNSSVSQHFIQIGQGSTPPARADFIIETPFANGGDEDVNQIYSNGGYSSGQTKASINLTTTGTGTITEMVNYAIGRDSAGTNRSWMWARDLISPGVAFIAAQSVFAEYTWQI